MHALVVGIANLQTSVPVDGFPVEYAPVRFLHERITTTVSGVGFNQARQLAALGDSVQLAAILGADAAGSVIASAAEAAGLDTSLSVRNLRSSPRSVALVDPSGRPAIFTDFSAALQHRFDEPAMVEALAVADVAVLGNLDLSRPLLAAASSVGTPVAIDLQVVRDSEDEYQNEFLAADIVSMSGEALNGIPPADFLLALRRRSSARLLVLTLAANGCLAVGTGIEEPLHIPAVPVDVVRTSIGAGDCFFATLVHGLVAEQAPPATALQRAVEAAAKHLAAAG